VLSSCGGGKDDPTPNPQPKELGVFELVFPDNNQICTESDEVGNNEISIELMWSASQNATSYALELTNTGTGELISTTSNTTSKTVTLPKDAQFSWKVTALLADKTKQSTGWSFYTEGVAKENFAPFPAEITVLDNTNSTVDISWEASDLDNDIENFDLKIDFGTGLLTAFEKLEVNEMKNYSIDYDRSYNVEVITRDSRGNISIAKTSFDF